MEEGIVPTKVHSVEINFLELVCSCSLYTVYKVKYAACNTFAMTQDGFPILNCFCI